MLTHAELNEWKTHPVTEEFLARLEENKKIVKEQISNGSLLGTDKIVISYSELVGYIRGLEAISKLLEEYLE